MVSKYILEVYRQGIFEGDFCSIYFQEGFDGLGNSLDFFNFMKRKGWKLIASDIRTSPFFEKGCLADNTLAEFLFEKINYIGED